MGKLPDRSLKQENVYRGQKLLGPQRSHPSTFSAPETFNKREPLAVKTVQATCPGLQLRSYTGPAGLWGNSACSSPSWAAPLWADCI